MATNPPLSDWSKLVSDVLLLVYERLSFSDFVRAMTVCSSWYSVSRSSRKNNVPWLIIKQKWEWKLFDPEESKFYKTHNTSRLGLIDACLSLASCGRWVLVIDKEVNLLNIFNPFTSEIIHLPPLDLSTSVYKILDNCPISFDYGPGQRQWVKVTKAVLWVDEITKDYLVVFKSSCCNRNFLYFCMKGDNEWTKTPKCEYVGDWCVDMAYKDKKLYILSDSGSIMILDFSQDFPVEVLNHPYVVNKPFDIGNRIRSTRMKLTTSGDVVLMIRDSYPRKFEIYKMNNTNKEWEIVDSLEEDEAFVWDLSLTLPTKGVSGIKKDTIYFCDTYRASYEHYDYDCESYFKTALFERARTYEIPTKRIERFGELDLRKARDVRWLLPFFGKGLANRDKVDTIHGPIQVPSLKGAWTKKLNFTTPSLQ